MHGRHGRQSAIVLVPPEHGGGWLFGSGSALQSDNMNARLRGFDFPGPERLNSLIDGLLKQATKANVAELASEDDFKGRFPECEIGAMPPFGNLYGIDVFADEALAKDKEIAFNACSHRELIRLAWEDFERLAQRPRVVALRIDTTVENATLQFPSCSNLYASSSDNHSIGCHIRGLFALEIVLDNGNVSVTITHGRGSGVPGSERI